MHKYQYYYLVLIKFVTGSNLKFPFELVYIDIDRPHVKFFPQLINFATDSVTWELGRYP